MPQYMPVRFISSSAVFLIKCQPKNSGSKNYSTQTTKHKFNKSAWSAWSHQLFCIHVHAYTCSIPIKLNNHNLLVPFSQMNESPFSYTNRSKFGTFCAGLHTNLRAHQGQKSRESTHIYLQLTPITSLTFNKQKINSFLFWGNSTVFIIFVFYTAHTPRKCSTQDYFHEFTYIIIHKPDQYHAAIWHMGDSAQNMDFSLKWIFV